MVTEISLRWDMEEKRSHNLIWSRLGLAEMEKKK